MNKQKLTVKVSTLKETIADFKDIWKRHAQGEKFDTPVESLRFENTFTLMKTLSPRRLELLQQLHTLGETSIRSLAKKLEREYSNVHQDIKALHHVGLVLQNEAGKYSVPWDKIVTEIPMTLVPAQETRKSPKGYAPLQTVYR